MNAKEVKKVDEVIDVEPKTTEDTTTQTTEKEPEKKESVFKKLGNGVKKLGEGVKKGLNHEVKLWQIIAAPVIIAGAVIGAKAIYDKGHNDALNEMDINDVPLPEIPEEPMMALEVEDEPEEKIVEDVDEVIDVEPEEVYEEEVME